MESNSGGELTSIASICFVYNEKYSLKNARGSCVINRLFHEP